MKHAARRIEEHLGINRGEARCLKIAIEKQGLKLDFFYEAVAEFEGLQDFLVATIEGVPITSPKEFICYIIDSVGQYRRIRRTDFDLARRYDPNCGRLEYFLKNYSEVVTSPTIDRLTNGNNIC